MDFDKETSNISLKINSDINQLLLNNDLKNIDNPDDLKAFCDDLDNFNLQLPKDLFTYCTLFYERIKNIALDESKSTERLEMYFKVHYREYSFALEHLERKFQLKIEDEIINNDKLGFDISIVLDENTEKANSLEFWIIEIRKIFNQFKGTLKQTKDEFSNLQSSSLNEDLREQSKHSKLKLNIGGALAGYLFRELIDKGYLEPKLHNGEESYEGTAKAISEHFEMNGKESTFIKSMNPEKNDLSETKRQKLILPKKSDLD